MTNRVQQGKKALARITKKCIAKTREVLGPNGEYWIKGSFEKQNVVNTFGKTVPEAFCLIGAHRRAFILLEGVDDEFTKDLALYYDIVQDNWDLPSAENFFNTQIKNCANTLGLSTYRKEVFDTETSKHEIIEETKYFEQAEEFNDMGDTTFEKLKTAIECSEKKCDEILAQPDDPVIDDTELHRQLNEV